MMIDPERENTDRELQAGASHSLSSSRDASWRYLGDRATADAAYCARFGVAQAPVPFIAPGGAWAYAPPLVEPSR